MFIKELTIKGYGPFKNCTVPLWDASNEKQNITLFIGENGAGKTVLLTAITTLLSWFVARVRSAKTSGSPIAEHCIHNQKAYAQLSCTLYAREKDYNFSLVKAKKGRQTYNESTLKEVSRLAESYAADITADPTASLPLIAYYPTERYLLDIPRKSIKKHTCTQIDGYESALPERIDFSHFFEWLKNINDILNTQKISFDDLTTHLDKEKLTDFLSNYNITDIDLPKHIHTNKIKEENNILFNKIQHQINCINQQYSAVLHAIENFIPGYYNLRILRHPHMRMFIHKDGQELDVVQLSQGEKSLLALVGDIARRLAIINPSLNNPLEGEGIILIDEVDLHLHPKWQCRVVRCLRETFPNCQFLLTTHSPLVVSNSDNIQVFSLASGEIYPLHNLYGMDIEQLYLKIINTPLRDEKLQQEIDAIFSKIQDGNLEIAKILINKLEEKIPQDHIELVRAKILLHRFEAIREKNNKEFCTSEN